jgi:hypothetical protein
MRGDILLENFILTAQLAADESRNAIYHFRYQVPATFVLAVLVHAVIYLRTDLCDACWLSYRYTPFTLAISHPGIVPSADMNPAPPNIQELDRH